VFWLEAGSTFTTITSRQPGKCQVTPGAAMRSSYGGAQCRGEVNQIGLPVTSRLFEDELQMGPDGRDADAKRSRDPRHRVEVFPSYKPIE
jgi:hypothetical protein